VDELHRFLGWLLNTKGWINGGQIKVFLSIFVFFSLVLTSYCPVSLFLSSVECCERSMKPNIDDISNS